MSSGITVKLTFTRKFIGARKRINRLDGLFVAEIDNVKPASLLILISKRRKIN